MDSFCLKFKITLKPKELDARSPELKQLETLEKNKEKKLTFADKVLEYCNIESLRVCSSNILVQKDKIAQNLDISVGTLDCKSKFFYFHLCAFDFF